MRGSAKEKRLMSQGYSTLREQNIINILQDSGICVSAGSACAKGHRSHTLTAMGLSPQIMDSSFRVSISRETTAEELDKLVDMIREAILPRVR